EYVPGLPLLDHPRGPVAELRLRSRVRGHPEPERLRVVEGRLPSIAHVVLHVVDAHERHEVLGGRLLRLIQVLCHRHPPDGRLDRIYPRRFGPIREPTAFQMSPNPRTTSSGCGSWTIIRANQNP